MIRYDEFYLDNGLRVLVHEDPDTASAVLNLLYDVGSRDEDESRTGFAHLFEHLMFGGSANIPVFDEPLQRVGGENNAFTSPDITNYYVTLPAANLETAFWLESDRMLSLSWDPKVLEVQQKVVIEEYKQRYLNQPYGDVWLKLRDLAYTTHPYRWPTIGREIRHIEEATMEDVRAFFAKHYLPSNAILVVAGPVKTEEVKRLAAKWFGPIPAGTKPLRQLPKEPAQTQARRREASGKVPLPALYKAFHVGKRTEPSFYPTEVLAELLGSGKSSRLHQKLVKEEALFNNIACYNHGSYDPGLLVIEGKLNAGVSFDTAEAAVQEVLDTFLRQGPQEQELAKVKNQTEAALLFGESELLNRAMNLAFSALMGDPNQINLEAGRIQAVTADQVLAQAQTTLLTTNSNTLLYHPE